MAKHINKESDLAGVTSEDSIVAKPGTVRMTKPKITLSPLETQLLDALQRLYRHRDQLNGGCSVSDDLRIARNAIERATA